MTRSNQKLVEFLERCKNDPVFFCKHMLGMDLHAGQVDWMTKANEPINCLLPGNRWGKSTVVAAKHIWRCFTKKDFVPFRSDQTWANFPYATISVSVSADQAEIVFGMAKRMLQNPAIRPFVKRIYATPFPTIHFINGATMTCRSAHDDGKYVDGHRYDYVSIDEAGWITDLKKLINAVVLMRLAGGGKLDLIGTPKGISEAGFYFYASRGLRGTDGYYAQRGSTFDNIYLPAEDIKRREILLAQADPRLRDQVLYGAFVSEDGLAFTQDQLDRMFDHTLPTGQSWREGRRYIQAWDLGRQTDWTVGVTFDVTDTPWVLVDYQRLNRVPWEVIYTLIGEKKKEYKVHMPRIDATGPQGDVIEEELAKRGIFVDPYKVSTGALKLNLVNTLQTALDHGRQQIGTSILPDENGVEREVAVLETAEEGDWGLIRMPPLPQLVDEFGIYQLMDKKLTQDSVMAVGLAIESIYDGVLLEEPEIGGIYA